MNFDNSSLNKLFGAFKPAFKGIGIAFKSERNLRFHSIAIGCVIIFSFVFYISVIEWLIILVFFALVIALELINTAIEKLCNVIQPEKDERIRIIKDISAGAVLWVAIMALIAGLLIFIPKIFSL
ncbi:MAG: diacylglycerol kinase family protein [Lentimicrobium sp.]|jgi:diacylglycerol kinase|nr:diacylglycerol kinase family protein [Lentimicrobium sp.]